MSESKKSSGLSRLQVTGLVLAAVAAGVALTLYFAQSRLFPKPFQPVSLSAVELNQLELKLARLEHWNDIQPPESPAGEAARPARDNARLEAPADLRVEPLEVPKPEPYSEDGLSREINFNERELNALLADNTDLAGRLALDLADDLLSANMLITLPPDFPFMGGKTLRVRTGLELAYRAAKPVVVLRGVSIMGVPLPNAWLGGMKNIDLVEQFGTDQGFWQAFADGVESIQVQEGKLQIRLKE
ncbi:MAG: arginine N-succinyltransferase [bacterium]|nr:arginine N-succinyltransferase [bacterium]